MADSNSEQAPPQFLITTGPNAPPPGAEAQEIVCPPWRDGSDPEVPVVDSDDNPVPSSRIPLLSTFELNFL
jgi:hypothetical protein